MNAILESGLTMILVASSTLYAGSCKFDLPDDDSEDKEEESSGQGGTDGSACTEDAKVICIESAPGMYEQKSVGRSGPGCTFKSTPGEVDLKLCETGPGEPMACTTDAKLVCVETAPGLYEEKGVGRTGPDCQFPTLENEVEAENCASMIDGDAQCQQLHATVMDELNAVRACDSDADCTVRAGGCPFGCWQYHNRNADLAALNSAIGTYHQATCDTCDYMCVDLPPESELVCRNNLCTHKDVAE